MDKRSFIPLQRHSFLERGETSHEIISNEGAVSFVFDLIILPGFAWFFPYFWAKSINFTPF